MTLAAFGPRRSRASRRPDVYCPQITFLRCPHCSSLILLSGMDAQSNTVMKCCGQPPEQLIPLPTSELPGEMKLSYKIAGGPNENAVQAFWKDADETHKLEWLYLKTFSGGQLKVIPDHKRSPAVFALADEDAYVYCDKQVCEECTFRCKHGFVLYGWFAGIGLVECPLERMNANGAVHRNEKQPHTQ